MIVVAMIVKDEALTIEKTLASIRETLGPELRAIVVHDTGSSDGTQMLCVKHGVQLTCTQWHDFSTNRNAVLADAEALASSPDTDAILMLDAGTILRGELGTLPWVSGKTAGWLVRVQLGTITFTRPQLFIPRLGWKYEGLTHEAAITPAGYEVFDTESGLVVDYCMNERPAKRWERDVEILENDYSPRGRFYYAQSLELTGHPALAYFWYLHRGARTDGWYQERCMAYVRAIKIAPSYAAAQWCCSQALAVDGTRREAWLQFAKYAASCAKSAEEWKVVGLAADEALVHVPDPKALFVDTDREWTARELSARSWFWLGHKATAKKVWEDLLPDAPEWARTQIMNNLRFCP